MSEITASVVIDIARRCRKAATTDPLGPVSGAGLVQLARGIEDYLQPRNSPGRRQSDIDKDAQIERLSQQLTSLSSQLEAAVLSLNLATALLNRERGFDAAAMTIGGQHAHPQN